MFSEDKIWPELNKEPSPNCTIYKSHEINCKSLINKFFPGK